MSERLETPSESALGLAHPLGDGPDLPVVRAEQHDHTVGFPEWIRAEDYPLVVDYRHEVDRVSAERPSLGTMPLLPEADILAFTGNHPDWSWTDDSITRTFELEDFKSALDFVNRVGESAEEAGHHPDIDVRWNQVTLTLSTHSEGGLTEKDLSLAEEIDGLA